MAKVEVLMPSMGESIFECTVIQWLVKEGDIVETDDMIIEVATDKIDTEIGSSNSGKIVKLLVKNGDVAKIGEPICIIESEKEENITTPPLTGQTNTTIEKEIAKTITNNGQLITKGSRFYSPLVRNIAHKEGVGIEELEKISGSGMENRLTKDDLLSYLDKRNNNSIIKEPAKAQNEDRIIEMDRMRKIIAERMVESKRTSPHVTSFIETDMTRVSQWRTVQNEIYKNQYDHSFTYTPILIEAVVKAIQKYPGINAQVGRDKIILKKNINIGLAVALPNGNLIVPVIHNADRMNLKELAHKVHELALGARNNQLRPSDLVDGTYTISNIGSFGNISGTPIIVQPQVAIMAFGMIRKLPSVIETLEGDLIGIRQKMVISHSYDHRIIDGSLGGLFLKEVSDNLENFNTEQKL